ncbi:hypothetical protein CLV80_104295 [Yoonia maritima]|uniref:Type IV pilus biogenesis protein PilP n=1 Tax=Yoonia maritima TaxID=1435347 RepID=A0A2T0W0P1_9RHOB|nr:hypothetical protein [Yoonia maritima]PRY78327.1 hypothetical protein CLV80_104295 [Yoonia maritima]
MTTNFALSLSFEGIELLHRVARGWKRVGTADVEDDNLDAILADLRAKATKLDPSEIRTKLVIPMDQIKYLAIDSTQTNLDDIHAALDGATPYDLDDLVVDYERSGGRTHIAAVARETLQEAESFASAHQFNPVAFVAVPEPFTFQKEVFFGATSVAADILGPEFTVERDQLPVMKVGTRVKSRLLIMDPLPDAIVEDNQGFDLAAALAPIIAEETPPIETAPEESVEAPALPTVETTIWIDRIVREVHTSKPTVHAPAEIIAPRAPVVADNPILADISGLNLIIAEHHANAVKKPVLSAAAPKLATPRKGAGLTATKTRPTPIAANSTKKPMFIAGGLAASVAAIALFAWMQMDGSAELTQTVETGAIEIPDIAPVVVTPSIENTTTEEPVETVVAQIPLSDIAPTVSELSITEMPSFATDDNDASIPVQLNAFTVPSVPDPLLAGTVDLPPTLFTTTPPVPTETPLTALPATSGRVLSPAEAQTAYDATGVWQRAPRLFDTPRVEATAAVDLPVSLSAPDHPAQPSLPARDGMEPDLSFIAPVNPPAPDVVFAIDADGHIIPTAEGTLTPEGAMVYAGLPDLTLRERPELSEDELERMALVSGIPDGVVVILGRPDIVPPLRPANAVLPDEQEPEVAQAPTPGGVGLDTLTSETDNLIVSSLPNVVRPQPRPDGLVTLSPTPDPSTPDITAILQDVIAESATDPFIGMTDQAVATSRRPETRPNNFDRVVAAARQRQASQPTVAAAAPPPAAASVAPQNYAPVPGGVARAATQDGAIRLRDLNLIGIYGRPNSPRALVRLGNGRYTHVEIGSSLDGGQVTAIGDGILNYVKRGRTVVLELPGS